MERMSSYEYHDLLACAHGTMFGPGNARLPLPPMLMFNRITKISEKGGKYGKGVVLAELDVNPDLWFFSCHFENDPVMPGCLGLDATWQMLGFFLAWLGKEGRGRALGVGDSKFSGMILPSTKKVEYGIDIKRLIELKLSLGIANGWVKADDKVIYTIENLRVGLFEEENEQEDEENITGLA